MGLNDLGKNNKKTEENSNFLSIGEVFARNREYISSFGADAEKINGQFIKKGRRDTMRIGTVSCPSGKLVIGDPLAYIGTGKYSPELEIQVSRGEYPVDISIIRSRNFGLRICSARLKISEGRAVHFELARPTENTAVNKGPDGAWTGFPVDAGMAAFMDAAVCEKYASFIDEWHEKNPDKNHYDDYFAEIFAESYEKTPDFQRKGGDFIEWTIPETQYKTTFFATGFGDGFYQAFWGYDENGKICELVLPFVDADAIDAAENGFEEMERRMIQPNGCLATKKLMENVENLGYLYRGNAVKNVPDSGWRLFVGDEDDAYLADNDNIEVVPLEYICKIVPAVFPLLDSPVGSAYYKNQNGEFVFEKKA